MGKKTEKTEKKTEKKPVQKRTKKEIKTLSLDELSTKVLKTEKIVNRIAKIQKSFFITIGNVPKKPNNIKPETFYAQEYAVEHDKKTYKDMEKKASKEMKKKDIVKGDTNYPFNFGGALRKLLSVHCKDVIKKDNEHEYEKIKKAAEKSYNEKLEIYEDKKKNYTEKFSSVGFINKVLEEIADKLGEKFNGVFSEKKLKSEQTKKQKTAKKVEKKEKDGESLGSDDESSDDESSGSDDESSDSDSDGESSGSDDEKKKPKKIPKRKTPSKKSPVKPKKKNKNQKKAEFNKLIEDESDDSSDSDDSDSD